MLNIFLILFLVFMAYWWSMQGLFSSLLHLVITIFAAVLALAVWEPLTVGFLIGRMPEYAWGTGLLIPFGLILLGLRILFDKTIRANVYFPHLLNLLGGGALGFVSGVITGGILIIGLQMAGVSQLPGYEGWTIDDKSQVARKQSLLLPIDAIASRFINTIGNGSMQPMFGSDSLALHHPDLAVEASLFHKSAFWPKSSEAARRSIDPAHVELIPDAFIAAEKLTDELAAKVNRPADAPLIVVGTQISLQGQTGPGAADANGAFYATASQISLTTTDKQGRVAVHAPIGFIHNGEYRAIAIEGDYAFSAPQSSVKFHWVFAPAAGAAAKLHFIRIKGARIALKDKPATEPEAIAALITYEKPGPAIAAGNGDGTGENPSNPAGVPGGAAAEFARVSDALPWTINRNQFASQNVETVDDAIRVGKGRVRKEQTRVGKNLSVKRIFSASNARIVQINLGDRKAESLLGRVIETAVANTQAPVVVDANGQEYFAIGYGIIGGEFTFDIDPGRGIRALSQLELSRVSGSDTVVLYYQVPTNTKLVEFRLGGAQKQEMSLEVK
jgi:hypothetical protein